MLVSVYCSVFSITFIGGGWRLRRRWRGERPGRGCVASWERREVAWGKTYRTGSRASTAGQHHASAAGQGVGRLIIWWVVVGIMVILRYVGVGWRSCMGGRVHGQWLGESRVKRRESINPLYVCMRFSLLILKLHLTHA